MILLLPGPTTVLHSLRFERRHLDLKHGQLVYRPDSSPEDDELYAVIQSRAPIDALVTGDFESTMFESVQDPTQLLDLYSSARIAVGRTTLPQSRLPELADSYHIAHLAAGLKQGHLLALRAEPSVGRRQIWGIDNTTDPIWPGS